jgi:hypothetical protein
MTESRPDYNFFGIALGGAVLVLGLILIYEAVPEADREGPVFCDGKEMHPGDVCWFLGGGGADIPAKNYDTMAAEQLTGHGWLVWLLCPGILISVGAVIVTGLYIGYVRSSASRGK